jgi:hypothetical protein
MSIFNGQTLVIIHTPQPAGISGLILVGMSAILVIVTIALCMIG